MADVGASARRPGPNGLAGGLPVPPAALQRHHGGSSRLRNRRRGSASCRHELRRVRIEKDIGNRTPRRALHIAPAEGAGPVSTFATTRSSCPRVKRGRIHRHKTQERVYIVLSGTLAIVFVKRGRGQGARAGARIARVAPRCRRYLVNRHPRT